MTSDSHGQKSLGVACLQFSPVLGSVEENLEATVGLVEEAAAAGSELLVLPELALSGYGFRNREHAAELAEPIPGGRGIRVWRDLARQRRVWLVGGLAEAAPDGLYDSSVLIDRQGEVRSVYRKMHLWSRENLWFDRGQAIGDVVELPFGRLSMAICFDLWIPELFRRYGAEAADIVCMPSNWSATRELTGSDRPIVDHLAIALAHVNAIYIAAADRGGAEAGRDFLGASMIVSPRGDVLARASGVDGKPAVLRAQVDPSEAVARKEWGSFNHALDVHPSLISDGVGKTGAAVKSAVSGE